jgi:hypothetical protein
MSPHCHYISRFQKTQSDWQVDPPIFSIQHIRHDLSPKSIDWKVLRGCGDLSVFLPANVPSQGNHY